MFLSLVNHRKFSLSQDLNIINIHFSIFSFSDLYDRVLMGIKWHNICKVLRMALGIYVFAIMCLKLLKCSVMYVCYYYYY